MARQPGFLTERYLRGNRKPYLKPLQLFLLLNLLYFVTLHFFGANTFTSPLETHLENRFYGNWARSLVDAKLARRGELPAEYARLFNARSATAAKSLIFLMIPMYALLLTALYRGAHHYLVEHVVFATHFMAWWLLFMLTVSNLLVVLLELTVGTALFDLVATSILVASIFIYCFVALQRVYGTARWPAAAKATAVTLGTFAIIVVYRLLLFVFCYLAT